MEQLTFLTESAQLDDIQYKIQKLEESFSSRLEELRKSMFAHLGGMKKDYLFIYDNFEIIKDLVLILREEKDGKISNKIA